MGCIGVLPFIDQGCFRSNSTRSALRGFMEIFQILVAWSTAIRVLLQFISTSFTSPHDCVLNYFEALRPNEQACANLTADSHSKLIHAADTVPNFISLSVPSLGRFSY